MHTFINFGHGQVPWFEAISEDTSIRKYNIHLSPANGIPVASYQSLMSAFSSQYNFTGLDCRGAWPAQASPRNNFNWNDHANDLISAVESQFNEPIIGMGHSLGGTVTLLAAKKRPDLFSKLIIIDAASLPNAALSYISGIMPRWLSFKAFKFIKRTHERQRIWESQEAFYDNYKNHSTYRSFTETAFQDYVKYGLRERSDGKFELIFNPEWESHNFRKVHYLWGALKDISHPTLLLRAENTYMYSQKMFDARNKHLAPNITAQTIPATNHLVTHESPEVLSSQILKWLQAQS